MNWMIIVTMRLLSSLDEDEEEVVSRGLLGHPQPHSPLVSHCFQRTETENGAVECCHDYHPHPHQITHSDEDEEEEDAHYGVRHTHPYY